MEPEAFCPRLLTKHVSPSEENVRLWISRLVYGFQSTAGAAGEGSLTIREPVCV